MPLNKKSGSQYIYGFRTTNPCASPEEAVRLGYDAMAIGADAIMCQWSLDLLKLLQKLEPVQGHAGLVLAAAHGPVLRAGKTLDEQFGFMTKSKS